MTTGAVETERIGAERWIILLGLITAAIMEVLDTTIVNVALPQMAGNLGATQQEISWVSTGYILSNVVVLPMTAFFTERFGRRRYLTASIILFAVASLPVRHLALARGTGAMAHRPGRRRRGAALHRAGHDPPDLPSRAAGPGPVDLSPGHYRGADAWPHARRLDHRQLQLELVLLHQRPDRDALDVSGHNVPQGSSRPAAPDRRRGLARNHPAHRRARRAAVRARGRKRGRLVQRPVDPAPVDRGGRSASWPCSGGSSRRGTGIRWSTSGSSRIGSSRPRSSCSWRSGSASTAACSSFRSSPRACSTSLPPRPGWRSCRAAWPRRRRRSSAGGC